MSLHFVLLIGVFCVGEDFLDGLGGVDVGLGSASFSFPLTEGRGGSGAGVLPALSSGDLLVLTDADNFGGDGSFSTVGGGGLLGFLLGEANARISSSVTSSKVNPFFRFMGPPDEAFCLSARSTFSKDCWSCFLIPLSLSLAFSIAITSSSRSIDPSSTGGGRSTGLGLRAFGFGATAEHAAEAGGADVDAEAGAGVGEGFKGLGVDSALRDGTPAPIFNLIEGLGIGD